MPPDAAPLLRMSAAEYLDWERQQSCRHEFHEGQVFAMAGGSPRHNFLAMAVGAELRAGMRDRPCHVLSSDQRIAADAGTRYVYADAVRVEHFQRETGGTWRYRVLGAGARLTLRDGASFAVDDVYRGAFELEAG
jgi:Uma2 family endonuclease